MNRKQLIKLLVILIIVGGLGVVAYKKSNSSWKSEASTDKTLLANFEENDVNHITLKKGTDEVNLEKKSDIWTVRERKGYPANFENIRDLVQKIHDAKVVQTDPIGASQLARMQLVATGAGTNSGLAVDLKGAGDKAIGSLIMGKFHVKPTDTATAWGGDAGGWPDGRYVLVQSSPDTVKLVSEPFKDTEPKAPNWINKDFFHIEKPKAITFVSTNSADSWKLSRESETGSWKLDETKPGENLDTNKVSNLNFVMATAAFTDIAVNPSVDDSWLDKKALLVTIETFDHFTYALKIGHKTDAGDHYFTFTVNADLPKERTPGKDEKKEDKDRLDKEFKDKMQKAEDKLKQEKAYEAWTYMLPGYNVDNVIQARSTLMVSDKKEDKAGAPSPMGMPAGLGMPSGLPHP